MLMIRQEQLRILGQSALYSRLDAAARTFFPEHCAALGAAGLRELVRSSAARSSALGFGEPEAQTFFALEMAFGPEFYERPEYGWAGEILRDRSLKTPEERMTTLRNAAVMRLGRIAESEPDIPEDSEPLVETEDEREDEAGAGV